MRLGRPDEAIPYAKQAIRLDPLGPQVAVPHIDLGNAHLLRAEYPTAIEWFRRAKSLNSRLPRLYPGFAAALAHTGQLNEARGVVHDLLDLAPHFGLSRSPDYPTPYSPPEYVRLFESVSTVWLPRRRLRPGPASERSAGRAAQGCLRGHHPDLVSARPVLGRVRCQSAFRRLPIATLGAEAFETSSPSAELFNSQGAMMRAALGPPRNNRDDHAGPSRYTTWKKGPAWDGLFSIGAPSYGQRTLRPCATWGRGLFCP